MNEWLLVITVVVLIIVAQLVLRQLKQPVITYVQITCTVLLNVLIWGFGEQDKWPVNIIMTAVVAASFVTTVKGYRKWHAHPVSDRKDK